MYEIVTNDLFSGLRIVQTMDDKEDAINNAKHLALCMNGVRYGVRKQTKSGKSKITWYRR